LNFARGTRPAAHACRGDGKLCKAAGRRAERGTVNLLSAPWNHRVSDGSERDITSRRNVGGADGEDHIRRASVDYVGLRKIGS